MNWTNTKKSGILTSPKRGEVRYISKRLSATRGATRRTVSWEKKIVLMPILPRQKKSKMQRLNAKKGIDGYGDSNYRTLFLDEKRFELMAMSPDWLLGPESDPFVSFGVNCHQIMVVFRIT